MFSVVDFFIMHYQMLGITIIDSGIEDDGCIDGSGIVIGTYLHGLFGNKNIPLNILVISILCSNSTKSPPNKVK